MKAWPPSCSGIKGAIGYVEYAYAKQNKMAYTLLQNKDGAFVAPNDKTFQSAAAGADWKNAPGFYEILTDEPGKNSWPITGATFILMHKAQADGDKAEGSAQVLRVGPIRTATRWRSSSTTSPCPTTS